MAVNLDHLDTPVPADGAEFEFRGQVFRLRRFSIEEQFDEELAKSVKFGGWENLDELKQMFGVRMFRTKGELNKFWKTVTTKYDDPETGVERAPLQLRELITLTNAMMDISNGVYDPDAGGEDPKDGESSTKSSGT